MATKYERCPPAVIELASEVLTQFENYRPILDARVTFDYVFAWGKRSPEDEIIQFAIKRHGARVYGQARRVSLKDRACGRADGEVLLDADWWDEATAEQRKALLDHELYHFMIVLAEDGTPKRDVLHRPLLALRHHDVEFGWFAMVAARHGMNSVERQQAGTMFTQYRQAFWPQILQPAA